MARKRADLGQDDLEQKSNRANTNTQPFDSDESHEEKGETNCGNVYVSGTYNRSLTVGSDDDVI